MKDIYVYEGTNVLMNKRDIHNQEELDQFENAMSSLSILNISRNGFIFKSLNDIFEIHMLLFNNVYEWAGQKRKINLYKEEPILNGLSVEYSDYRSITKSINRLNDRLNSIRWNIISKEEIVTNMVIIFSSLWQIHPFREGNTRSVSMLLFIFANSIGLKLNQEFVKENAKYFRNALVMASIGDYSERNYFEDFLKDALSIKCLTRNGNKYKTINEYEIDKYCYNYHSYKE